MKGATLFFCCEYLLELLLVSIFDSDSDLTFYKNTFYLIFKISLQLARIAFWKTKVTPCD